MWFKERRIPFQFVDLKEKEMSRGEFESVVSAIARSAGSKAEAIELMADKNSKDYASFAYLDDSEKEDKLFENQLLLNLPVCHNGKTAATVAPTRARLPAGRRSEGNARIKIPVFSLVRKLGFFLLKVICL